MKKVRCFVVLFDESLYTALQQEWVDFSVTYFEDHVVTRCLSSAFLGHTTSEDLKTKILKRSSVSEYQEDGAGFSGWT